MALPPSRCWMPRTSSLTTAYWTSPPVPGTRPECSRPETTALPQEAGYLYYSYLVI